MCANENFERILARISVNSRTIAEALEKLYHRLIDEKRLDMYPILAEKLVANW